jgi:hypothetical protein
MCPPSENQNQPEVSLMLAISKRPNAISIDYQGVLLKSSHNGYTFWIHYSARAVCRSACLFVIDTMQAENFTSMCIFEAILT